MRSEINTKRLVLLHSETCDKPFFNKFLIDGDSTRFLPLGRVYSQKEIDDHVHERRKHWVDFGFGTYQILLEKSSNYSIGYVGAEFVGSSGYIDLRYGILKDHSNQGFISEAVNGFLDSFFLEYKDIRIYGICFKENIGSLKILHKIGMKDENTVRPYGECDLIHMSLTKEEFQKN
jgi:ribosomal-protein-alanine N-acetyltransferase